LNFIYTLFLYTKVKMPSRNYTPGTKLSFDNGRECCTVLTEGNALVTRVYGSTHWEQMWLADWLIIAEGTEREDFIPVPKETFDEEDYSDMPPLIPFNFTLKTKEDYPNRPIGTKFKWILNEYTYRVAIMTKQGVHQVKAITEGNGECYYDDFKRYYVKRTFDSEESWRKSLPDGGQVFVY
jgi:hypothetical protein